LDKLKRMYSWPHFFPKGFPPDDAVPAHDRVYRLARAAPPTTSDFRPLILRSHRPFATAGEQCQACGLSVHRDRAESQKLQRIVPGFRTAIIITTVLATEHGLIKATPPGSTHHTWWIPEDVAPEIALEWL
jgi:hypothetical protein